MSELSQPDGSALPKYKDRWEWIAATVAMEFGQLQRHLGLSADNPAWTEDDSAD